MKRHLAAAALAVITLAVIAPAPASAMSGPCVKGVVDTSTTAPSASTTTSNGTASSSSLFDTVMNLIVEIAMKIKPRPNVD
jgi:hypothetical protein